MDLSVTDAYEVENHVPVSELRVGSYHRGAGGDDVIIDYHPPLGDRPQQHEVWVQTVMVDALQGIAIERNAESVGDYAAYLGGEMEAIGVPAPRSGDDAPVCRIANECRDEFARDIGKHRGMIGRRFNLPERQPFLAPLELRDVVKRANAVQRLSWSEVATRNVVA